MMNKIMNNKTMNIKLVFMSKLKPDKFILNLKFGAPNLGLDLPKD